MTDRLAFSIPGTPRGKARPRARGRVVWQGGQPRAVVNVHSDPRMEQLEAEILRLFRFRYPRHQPWTGAVLIRFTAVFETPEGWNRALKAAALAGELYSTRKPDKDNIEKLIVDALNGWAWVDDAQVMGGGIKRYGSPARVDVILESLASPDVPATPAVRNAEARLIAGPGAKPQRRAPAKSTNAIKDPRLRAAVAKALDRERGR